MHSSWFFRVKPIARLIFKSAKFSRSSTISYQSLLLSTTVLNDSYNIVCTWLGWAMAMEILQRYVRDKCHTFEQTPKI